MHKKYTCYGLIEFLINYGFVSMAHSSGFVQKVTGYVSFDTCIEP